jgi:NAD dependent epimerase/dehydratase
MKWSGMRVLVTGAGGFIGSHLTERLVQVGAHPVAFLRYNSSGSRGWLEQSNHVKDIEFILGDIRDVDTVRQAVQKAEIVFHLAALIGIPYSYHAPVSYVQTNVEGSVNVLKAALDTGVKLFIHTSTSEVYGTAKYVPIDENHPLQGQSPYSASKIGGDKLAEAFHLAFNLPLITIRPFNTYGPRQSARAIIPTIITQALTQPSIRLGSLDPLRDLTYVEDTVEAFVQAAQHKEAIGEVINIGSGNETSVDSLVKTILEITGKKIPVEYDEQRVRPQASEVMRLCADVRKAQQLLGWQSKTDLKEGLAKTIDWLQKNLERYRPDDYAI